MPRNLQAIHLEEERYSPPISDEQLVAGASAAGASPEQAGTQPASMSPLEIQVLATGAVVLFLFLAFAALRCWLRRQQQLDHPQPKGGDGKSLVVAYEWGAGRTMSARMPLDGLRSADDVIAAAVEYGAEEFDPDMTVHSVEVRFTDKSGSTKLLTSKTKFSAVKFARVVRIAPLGGTPRERDAFCSAEEGRKKKKTKTRAPKQKRSRRGAGSRRDVIHKQLATSSSDDDDDDDDD